MRSSSDEEQKPMRPGDAQKIWLNYVRDMRKNLKQRSKNELIRIVIEMASRAVDREAELEDLRTKHGTLNKEERNDTSIVDATAGSNAIDGGADSKEVGEQENSSEDE